MGVLRPKTESERVVVEGIENDAKKTTKAAKEGGLLIAKAILPGNNFGEDKREMGLGVKSIIERAYAIINLESMAHSEILRILMALYLSIIISLLLVIALLILANQGILNRPYFQSLALWGLEGTIRTIGVSVQLFLLITVPLRIMIHSVQKNTRISPEQLVVIFLLLLVNFIPGFSIVALINFWDVFYTSKATVEYYTAINSSLTDNIEGELFNTLALVGLRKFSESAQLANRAMLPIFVSFGLASVGTISYSLSKPVVSGDEKIGTYHYFRILNTLKDACKHLWRVSNKYLMIYVIFYLSIAITLSYVYRFTISAVPLVGIITVFKVCATDVYCVGYNETTQDPYFGLNCTAEQLSVIGQGISICNPQVNDGLYFNRSMSQAGIFVAEISFLYLLHQITSYSSKKVATLPYESNRSKHLGFRFFQSNKRMMWSSILLCAFLLVTIMPTNFWILTTDSGKFVDLETVPLNVSQILSTITLDPMFSFGLTYYVLGFGTYQVLSSMWLLSLSYAYMPPNSTGFLGFFCDRPKPLSADDAPIYLVREEDVEKIRSLRREMSEQKKNHKFLKEMHIKENLRKLFLIKQGSTLFTTRGTKKAHDPEQHQQHQDDEENQDRNNQHQQQHHNQNDGDVESDHEGLEYLENFPTIVEQVHSNVFVMETEVLLWNFSHMAYELGSPEWDLIRFPVPEKQPRTSGNQLSLQDMPASEIVKKNDAAEKERNVFKAELEEDDTNSKSSEKKSENTINSPTTISNDLRPKTPQGEPIYTQAEKQAKIDDQRYILIDQIENPHTEIQCCVYLMDNSSSAESRIIISFRGTYTKKNVLTDIDYPLIPHHFAYEVEASGVDKDPYAKARASSSWPRVHRGFYYAYLSVRVPLLICVDRLLEEYTDAVIFTCGHSLGGAMATYCAFDIGAAHLRSQGKIAVPSRSPPKSAEAAASGSGYNGYNNFEDILLMSRAGRAIRGVQCSTFGAPRVGNFAFVSRVKTVVSSFHRFVIQADAVPKLPPARPMGEIFKYGYHHPGTEILMDLTGNLNIQPSFVERQMMHGWKGYNPSNHVRTSYAFALMLWCARVHGDKFVPYWWNNVLEMLWESETERLNNLSPELKAAIFPQLNREGIKFYINGVAHKSTGLDPDDEIAIMNRANGDSPLKRKSQDSSFSLLEGVTSEVESDQQINRTQSNSSGTITSLPKSSYERASNSIEAALSYVRSSTGSNNNNNNNLGDSPSHNKALSEAGGGNSSSTKSISRKPSDNGTNSSTPTGVLRKPGSFSIQKKSQGSMDKAVKIVEDKTSS